jgi:hypothetical protein
LSVSLACDSRVATKRVPSSAPFAPRASAAITPLPLAIPPAAMTGVRTARTTCGTRAIAPTSACCGEGRLTHVERWPPASWPCTTSASTPEAATVRASSTVATIAITFAPWAWKRFSTDWTARTTSSGMRETSAGGDTWE